MEPLISVSQEADEGLLLASWLLVQHSLSCTCTGYPSESNRL